MYISDRYGYFAVFFLERLKIDSELIFLGRRRSISAVMIRIG